MLLRAIVADGMQRQGTVTDLEAGGARRWVLTSFPAHLAASHPELAAHLETHFEQAAVFGGTVGGGAIIVWRGPRP